MPVGVSYAGRLCRLSLPTQAALSRVGAAAEAAHRRPAAWARRRRFVRFLHIRISVSVKEPKSGFFSRSLVVGELLTKHLVVVSNPTTGRTEKVILSPLRQAGSSEERCGHLELQFLSGYGS